MAAGSKASRVGGYLERLVDNPYAQENLRGAVRTLRAAYRRASKRGVEPARDEKLRRQLRQAARSIAEAGDALKAGRKKPQKARGKRILIVLGLGTLASAAALASSEELRNKVFGEGPEQQGSGDGAPASARSRSRAKQRRGRPYG